MANIIVIEDEKVLNEAYQIVLKNNGHHVCSALNGEEALECFKRDRIDLVLLDLRMPKMDGVEFLKRLDPKRNYPDIDIIVFSNYDDQKEIDEAFKYGASRYILKAWSSPNELVKVVSETLNKNKDNQT